MFNNAKLKNIGFVALAAVLPILAFVIDAASAIMPMALLSGVVFAAVVAVGPWWLLALVPIIAYGGSYLLCANPYIAAFSLVFLPAGLCAGLCMRFARPRGFTVALTSFSMAFGFVLCFGLVVLESYGKITVSTITDCYNSLYSLIISTIYDNVYNALKITIEESGYTESFIATYTVAFIKSNRPMLFGGIIFTCNLVAYALTAAAKRIYKYLDEVKYSGLPGINGEWEFVLSKSSAIVFLVCYMCLLIGGESLSLPETSAFYAVMLAIVGGVFVMAFRSIRNRIRLTGGMDLIVIGIVVFLFFQSSIIDILSMVLVVIGLSATFKFHKKGGDKGEKA